MEATVRQEILDGVVQSIKYGNGSLAEFQRAMKPKLQKRPEILGDPEAVFIIGGCAEHDYYKHTEVWRGFLTKNFGFEFTKVEKEKVCTQCAYYKTSYGGKCWACNNTGKIQYSEMKATFNGRTMPEILESQII